MSRFYDVVDELLSLISFQRDCNVTNTSNAIRVDAPTQHTCIHPLKVHPSFASLIHIPTYRSREKSQLYVLLLNSRFSLRICPLSISISGVYFSCHFRLILLQLIAHSTQHFTLSLCGALCRVDFIFVCFLLASSSSCVFYALEFFSSAVIKIFYVNISLRFTHSRVNIQYCMTLQNITRKIIQWN